MAALARASSALAAAWWAQHPVTPKWMRAYRGSIRAPHRDRIVQALKTFEPFESVYELGCHLGPNLWAIRERYPLVRLAGCDVNAGAVKAARAWMGAEVAVGAWPAVAQGWPDRAVDVVLDCYALAYVAPEDIRDALRAMVRVARKGAVICGPVAWHPEACVRREQDGGSYAEWNHPYVHVLLTMPEMDGWTIHCHELSYPDNRITGLLVLERGAA